jgi:uncharacterized protein
MSVTKQLLELFRVDKQLRGLRSRLEASERFLSQQSVQLGDLDKQKTSLEAQLKQFRAVEKNEDGEAARIEARMAALREQMNTAKTAKEYNAFLNELNVLKEQKSAAETRELEAMTKADEIDKKLAELSTLHTDRSKIVGTAKTDRDTKAAEIKDRVAELTTQRADLASKIPPKDLTAFEALIKIRGDEAMAPVEVLDRRSHEGSCSACMMAIPVNTVSELMSGKLVTCPSCRCLLYVEEETFKQTTTSKKKSKEAAAT